MDYSRPEVRRLFSVPSALQTNNLPPYMVFLLQVLDDESPSFSSNGHFYSLLQEKLTFLHAILGDAPFQLNSTGPFRSLLTVAFSHLANLFNSLLTVNVPFNPFIVGFRSLANEVGTFIYSCVSVSAEEMRSQRFNAGVQPLLEKLDNFMNHRIKEYCIKHHAKTTRSSNHLPSLFIIGSLLEDLQDLVDGQFDFNRDDIRDQFNTLIKELTSLLPVLKDIEKSQIAHTNEKMQESVIHIIDLTYEAEYLINTHTAGHIPSWYLDLRLPIISGKIDIAGKRIQEIEIMDSVQEAKIQALRYPAEDGSNVVGFENVRERILADLIGRSSELQVVSLIGMSGIGKTTIAKKLFNDRAVGDYFDLHVWCTVSKTYEKMKVLDEIWMNLTRKSGKDEMVKYESLELGIYQTLFGRKYLIIMDDVWDSCVWDDLRSFFPNNGNGSRILFTSQIRHSTPAGIIFHELTLLSDSQCLELLMKKVSTPLKSLDVAKGIASKCRGLPLTVAVVSGILANVGNEESVWRNIERKMESYLFKDSSMCILELSYKYLPSHLKPCFLTLWWSSFRKDIRVRDIIPLWISHGFVEKGENKSQEEIAEGYILELINRSLLSISKRRSDGGIKVCQFHDLIFDMCCQRGRAEKFFCDLDMYSSFIYTEHSHLRTLSKRSNICAISSPYCRSVSIVKSALGYSVTYMPLLRVNYRQASPIDEKRVSGLVHLRYFSSEVRIARPPEGISKLVKLEYLVLPYCGIVDVPSSILKMAKLKHIDIVDQVIFLKDCDISNIRSNVRSLSCVRIRNHEDEEILKCTPHLQKLKCICEGLLPDVGSLTLLEKLNISVFESPRLKGDQTQMKFPSTLSKVTLSGTNLPWEESSALGRLPNLQVLKLMYDAFCGKEWETRDDEFQELRYLKMHNVLSLPQWTSYSEHFPKLRNLVLGHVRVEIPEDLGNISTLESIEVYNCVKETYESADLIREEQAEQYDNKNLKIIIRDTSSKHVLVQEEVSAPTPSPLLAAPPQQEEICPGCNTKYHGNGINWNGCDWHYECFCCHACKQQINDTRFNNVDGRPYHISCCKELHNPKCDVCKDYVRMNAASRYDYLVKKFWDQNYCISHKNAGTPKCCSCNRLEAIDTTYFTLEDDRTLCLECKESSLITKAEECKALYIEIQDFLQSLNIKMKQEIPLRLVNKQAMCEATKGKDYRSHLVYNIDHDSKLVVMNELLLQSHLPRMVTGDYIAYEMMKAWVLLEGYPQDLSLKVKGGIQQLLRHMWLEHEIVSGSSENGQISEFEKKLGDYRKYLIENHSDSDYRNGFWEGKNAVNKYGLQHTLDNIRRIRTFHHIAYHDSFCEDPQHPKCHVCNDYVPKNAAGVYDYRILKFWDQKFCPLHVADETPQCCGCRRYKPIDVTYSILDDGRALCLECKESSIIMNTEECQPLYMEIRDFFEGLNIKVKQEFPVLVVDSEAVKEATKGGIYEGEECPSNVLYKDRGADLSRIQLPTTTNNDSHVLAILVKYGFPRIVTGDCIAADMMEAWMSLEGYQDLSLKVQSGICFVLGYLWLEHESLSISSNKRKHSEFEKKLIEFRKYVRENDSRAVCRDGFREGKKAVDKYGLKHTLDHIRRTGTFPT